MFYKISISVTVREAGKEGYNDPDEAQYIDLVCLEENVKDIREVSGPVVNSMIQLCVFKLSAQLAEKSIE